MQIDSGDVQINMPLGRRKIGALAPLFLNWGETKTFSPSTLSCLHHRWDDRRRWASQSHSSVGVHDRDDFAGPVGRLLIVGVIMITGNSVNIGVGLRGREGDGGSNLLHGLNLVLQG